MSSGVNERGKRPLSVAAGPYGHPFHPILVTVPIGAWVASIVFDLLSLIADDPAAFTQGSLWLIGLGIVGALVAAIWGILDLLTIPTGTAARATGIRHMTLNLVVVALYAINFLLRRGDARDAAVETLPLVLSLFALALLGASGWLGGKLAYRYGIRVADEATQAEGFTKHR